MTLFFAFLKVTIIDKNISRALGYDGALHGVSAGGGDVRDVVVKDRKSVV